MQLGSAKIYDTSVYISPVDEINKIYGNWFLLYFLTFQLDGSLVLVRVQERTRTERFVCSSWRSQITSTS